MALHDALAEHDDRSELAATARKVAPTRSSAPSSPTWRCGDRRDPGGGAVRHWRHRPSSEGADCLGPSSCTVLERLDMTDSASMPSPARSRPRERAHQLFEFAQKALIVRDGSVLLVRKHDEAPDQGGRWELPGGRVERGEDLDAALCREVREEVGLDIFPGRPLAMWTWTAASGAAMISVIRECEATDFTVSMAGQQASDHLSKFAWVAKDAVCDLDLIPDARDSVVEALQLLRR